MRGEMAANLVLEADLLVKAHAATTPALAHRLRLSPRTSILPVTAAEIRALRRSCRRSMARLSFGDKGVELGESSANECPRCWVVLK